MNPVTSSNQPRRDPKTAAKNVGAALNRRAASLSSVTLTRAYHVREEAARLYNRCNQTWSRKPSATKIRSQTALLSLIAKVIVGVELEARVENLEARYQAAALGSKVNPAAIAVGARTAAPEAIGETNESQG